METKENQQKEYNKDYNPATNIVAPAKGEQNVVFQFLQRVGANTAKKGSISYIYTFDVIISIVNMIVSKDPRRINAMLDFLGGRWSGRRSST